MTEKNDIYLAHYGVKGQKWGVRRYQNKDGSLTSKGKKRYRNEPNENYSNKQRDRDRKLYGEKGEARINRRMNKGSGIRDARHKEVVRKKVKQHVKVGAAKTTLALAQVGSLYLYDQIAFGGAGTRAVKDTIKFTGRLAVTAYMKSRGAYDIRWYD